MLCVMRHAPPSVDAQSYFVSSTDNAISLSVVAASALPLPLLLLLLRDVLLIVGEWQSCVDDG